MGSGGTHVNGKGFSFVEVNSVRGSGKLICCNFSSDGKLLASGGHNKEAVLWYTDTLEPKATHEGHSMVITDVRFSPGLGCLATSSIDKTVRIWDIDNPGYSHQTFTGHSCGIASLDFHPKKDDLICSCDFGGEIRYWSISDGSCVGVFKGGKFQVRFQPCHGRFLAAAADNDNALSIMDAEKQTCLYSMKGHREPISYLCWDPSGELLASLSEDSIRIWTFTPGNEGKCMHELSSNGKNFYSCVFHPTHRSSLVIGCYQSLVIWDTIENRTKTLSAHGGIISSVAASTASGLVASTSHDNFVKLWK